jgi:hypothetical protein
MVYNRILTVNAWQQREQLGKAAVERGGRKLLFRWQEEIDGERGREGGRERGRERERERGRGRERGRERERLSL